MDGKLSKDCMKIFSFVFHLFLCVYIVFSGFVYASEVASNLEDSGYVSEVPVEPSGDTSIVKASYENLFTKNIPAPSGITGVLVFAAVIIFSVLFVVLVIVAVNLFINLKNVKSQNSKFIETLRMVSQMMPTRQQDSVYDALAVEYSVSLPDGEKTSGMGQKDFPPPPVTEEEKMAFEDFIRKCRDISVEIDRVTCRKNNSKNVAEIVFKLAREGGANQYEATLFYAVALIYDIGFLAVNPEIFFLDKLSDDQKKEIRKHVSLGLERIYFVPDIYRPLFSAGIFCHHENMDGSGYPDGLTGCRIPYIGRMIRVAESFTALVSKRRYRKIVDKEAALERLRRETGVYDGEIVKILEEIV